MQGKKLSVAVLLALGLCLSLAFTSWAQPWGVKAHGGHGGHWGKFANLTPEQAGKLFDLRQKFLDDSASLRKDMMVKRAELRALWRAENPDEKQILAKLKEINAVKTKLQEKVIPFRLEVKKILPKQSEPKKQLSMEDENSSFGNVMAMNPDDLRDVGL
ncbi:MAG: Spy/CpxP family protein refolding chaperone [Desulfobaccales bacterium]